tara:strand:+ start:36684 stop:37697 length:1014 start_codon:yes stop_codon:yes gene_type:complete
MSEEQQDQDVFLLEMQKSCLEAIKEGYGQLMGRTSEIATLRAEVLKEITEKNKEFIEDLENSKFEFMPKLLEEFNELLKEKRGQVISAEETDLVVFEFMLSDVLQNLIFYCDDIAKGLIDTEAKRESRQLPIVILKGWAPASETQAEQNSDSNADGGDESVVSENEAVAEKQNVAGSDGSAEGSQEATQEEETTPGKEEGKTFLIFQLRGNQFAIPIEFVVEVLKWRNVVPLPYKNPKALGLLNFYGEMLPVVELFNSAEVDVTDCEKKYFVVTQVKGERFSFFVDKVDQVVTFDELEEQPVSEQSSLSHLKVIRSLFSYEEQLTMVVDLNRIGAAA